MNKQKIKNAYRTLIEENEQSSSFLLIMLPWENPILSLGVYNSFLLNKKQTFSSGYDFNILFILIYEEIFILI